MKRKSKSFGMKLWLSFLLFAAVIFGALWLLQTVFLQSFYDGMAIANVKKLAVEIEEQIDRDDFWEYLNGLAAEHSVLIFVTDWNGQVLYSADEHSSLYKKKYDGTYDKQYNSDGNPYRKEQGLLNWQIGALRNLPQDYEKFLTRLLESENGTVGYAVEDGNSYIYGAVLPTSEKMGDDGAALYIGMQLGAVGATVNILRMQLVWVIFVSLVIAAMIAGFLSRQFSRPVLEISSQARKLAGGSFMSGYKKGFCRELDELADTLTETAAALEQLEQERRELLANVSHDLRTPLTMIKGYAEVIRDLSWNDEERREEDLAVIIREADRLAGLVNDILEYSAMEREHAEDDFTEIDISGLVQKVADQCTVLYGQQGYEIETVIETGYRVMGNEKQLERVLYNLIDNALSHSHSDHEKKVTVSLKRKMDTVRVEVRDYGEGIPRETLPYIWDRYVTSRERGQNRGRSGLGLAIVKEILVRHQAGFGVESEVGKGSVFWFELPWKN